MILARALHRNPRLPFLDEATSHLDVACERAVQLGYQAFPHQKFGHHRGVVARISRSAIGPSLPGPNGQAGEPYYRVVVHLAGQTILAYGKPEPLRPGMLLEADILGEERKLYEWVLEPLYSLTGRL